MAHGVWLEIVVAAAIFAPLACGVGVYLVLGLRRALYAEIGAIRSGAVPLEAARGRFLLQAARTRRTMVNLSVGVGSAAYLLAGWWVPLLLVLIAPGVLSRIGPMRLIPVLPGGMMLVLGLSAVTFFTFVLLGGLLIDLPYVRAFGGPTTTPAHAVRNAFLLLLGLYLPLFAIIAVVTAVVQQPDALVQFPWPEIALVVIGAGDLFGGWLRAWLAPSRPMEQTGWVALAPRIREWARLAGVELGAVRVHAGGWLGIADGVVRGAQRPVLSLSERFLANSDWRQQDALTAHLLGLARERAKRPTATLAWRVVEVACLVVIAGDRLVFTSGWLEWLIGFNWAPLALVGELVLLPVVFLVFAYSVLRHRLFGRTGRWQQVLAAGYFAAQLTGDPLALAVALHTLYALRRGPVVSFFDGLARNPTLTLERFGQLNQLLSQPGGRAWTDEPVPAIAAVQARLPEQTVALDQAPAPAPVPVAAMSAS